MYSDRIRLKTLLGKVVSPEQAASLIQDGMTIGMSGFTRAGDAKIVPMALAERAATENLKITLMTVASLGSDIDKTLTEAKVLSRRLLEIESEPSAFVDTTEPEEELPLHDHASLLDRLQGDSVVARLVLDTFLVETPNLVGAVRVALGNGDAEEVRRRAHALKGSAANTGMERLRQAALELEQAASRRPDDLPACAAELERIWTETERELRRIRT